MKSRKNEAPKGKSLGVTLFNPNQYHSGSIAVGIILNATSNTFCITIAPDPISGKTHFSTNIVNGPLTIEKITLALKNMEDIIKNDYLKASTATEFKELSIEFSHDNSCKLFSKSLTPEIINEMIKTAQETTLQTVNDMLEKKERQTCILS